MTASQAQVDGADVRVRVRPKFSLLGNAFASVVLGTTPIFAVLYWFTASRGGTALVVVANIAVLTAASLMVWRQLTLFCAVTDTELVGNGIATPLVRVPLARIHRVRLIRTFLGASPDPVLQLLVTDEDDRRLFRMRGTFWHDDDLRALARALPVPLEEPAEPLTLPEFFASYPGAAYWFENRRPLVVAILTVALLLSIVFAVWLMGLLGLPVRFL